MANWIYPILPWRLTAVLALAVVLASLLGCGGGGDNPGMSAADRQVIDSLIVVIEQAEGDWSAYVAKAKSLHVIGHIKLADLPGGRFGQNITYKRGCERPVYQWVTLDRAYVTKDPCRGASVLVHELAHLVLHRYGHELVDQETALFGKACNQRRTVSLHSMLLAH